MVDKPTATTAAPPPGVQKAPAPSKPVEPQTSPHEANATKKSDKEVAGPASEGNPANTDKATDTPSDDVGKGGTVATTGNLSPNKVAESGQPNTPNPPKAALQSDGGRTIPSEHDTNSPDHTGLVGGKPLPPDDTPIPTDAELAALDAKHGYENPVTAVTDNDDEKSSMRKFVEMARALPATTPDGQVFGGYGGVRITYGDIRHVARVYQRSFED